MAVTTLEPVRRHILRIAGTHSAQLTDGQLLQRFAACRDEDAFAALVRRHGRLVLSVCRRILGNAHDAEDAFQATFLILARKAATVRNAGALASWLHGTAHRTALEIKRKEARRRAREQRAAAAPRPAPEIEAALREVQAILDEEVAALPEKHRTPFVLCCLEGRSKGEAARELGWKDGTLSARLAQARERLRARLARRGVLLSAALTAVDLARDSAAAVVPAALAEATVCEALTFAAGGGLTAGARVAAALLAVRSKYLFAFVAVIALGVAGAGVLLRPGRAATQGAGPGAAPEPQPKAPQPVADPDRRPGTDAHGDPLPPGVLARLGTVRLRHGGAVKGVAFSADGRVIVSTGMENVLRVWDAATGKLLHRVPGSDSAQAFCLAMSPDSRTAAVGGNDRAIQLCDVATGRELRRLEGHNGPVDALAFSADGATLASGGWDKTARLWRVATGEQLRQLDGHGSHVMAVAFSPDGRTLATGGGDKLVILWDAGTGKELRRLEGFGHSVTSLEFTPDGKALLAACGDKTLRLFDPSTGKELRRFTGCQFWVRQVVFSPDGKLLAAACADFLKAPTGELRIWDVATGKELAHFHAPRGAFEGVAFAPDGKKVAGAGSFADCIRVWETATGKERWQFGHRGPVAPVAFSPDGRTVLTGSWHEAALRLWDAATGKELHRMPGDHGSFAPDGKTLIAFGRGKDSATTVRDTATGKELHRVPCPAGTRFAAVSDGGKLLAAVSGDGVLRLCAADTGKELRRFDGPALKGHPLRFSPDGKRLASAVEGGVVYLWDTATGKVVRELPGHNLGVQSLAFSPDGVLLAAAAYDDNVHLWDTVSGQELRRLRVEDKSPWRRFYQPAFSPDGRMLAAGTYTGPIWFWEVATGKARGTLRGHEGWVSALVFSPDGRRLLSGSYDTTALIWDLTAPGRLPRTEPTAKELDSLWTDLAGADADAAYRAILRLAVHPAQGVPFLSGRLRPAPRGDERMARLIADLGSARFAVRQKATQELEKLGVAAESALAAALAGNLVPEVQLRLRQLLRKVEGAATAERLRPTRALEALELAGTVEAHASLRRLAEGGPEAWLTREARKGLERLSRRQ